MTTVDRELFNPTRCPVVNHDQVNLAEAPAGRTMDHLDELREQAPVFTGWAEGHQYYLVTRMADARKAYQDPKVFSSSAVVPSQPDPPYMWIPEMLDGSIHVAWRQLLGPLWSPQAIAKLEPKLHARFAEILDRVVERGECEFVGDVALQFPNVIFMELMGLPVEDARQFQDWEVRILHRQHVDPDDSVQAMGEVIAYFADLVADRRQNPRADMISYVVGSQVQGKPIPEQDILDFCLLMFMAGLDTVAAQLTFNLWHLATHPDDRQRLVTDPGLWPTAIEEFLRYYSFVTPSRKVMQDTEIAGCPIKAGAMVNMPLVAVNRDPREFEDAGVVRIDRQVNRHVAFGAGPHRCVGSHLARAELFTAMTMWHERIPNYRLVAGAEVREHGGQLGLISLPLVWDV